MFKFLVTYYAIFTLKKCLFYILLSKNVTSKTELANMVFMYKQNIFICWNSQEECNKILFLHFIISIHILNTCSNNEYLN